MTGVRARLFRLLVTLAVASSTACTTPRLAGLPSDREWGPTLTRAHALANDGRLPQADSLLARYAAAYPKAPQSIEATYWRALLNLRSPTVTQSLSLAIPLLQVYVAAGPSTAHWMEADALLRAASRVDTLSRAAATYISRGEVSTEAAATARAAEAKATTADSKAQDEEIRRLKDELAKSKDELDRIKKRLAEPPKKPPRDMSP